MVPTFFVIGAPRSGTTSIYEYLNTHPEVFMSPVKAPEFFLDETLASACEDSVNQYLANFAGARGETRIGEGSASYLPATHAAARIKAFNSAARILILLRNPVDRESCGTARPGFSSRHSTRRHWRPRSSASWVIPRGHGRWVGADGGSPSSTSRCGAW